jgi:hypothetical protein
MGGEAKNLHSFLGRLAQVWVRKDDSFRRQFIQGQSSGEKVHDGRQSLVLYQQVPIPTPRIPPQFLMRTRPAPVEQTLVLLQ